MIASEKVFAITRPHPKLLTLYILRGFILPPISFIWLPILYFRYHTMKYRFDNEGISMSWGILFRQEVNLTYARIQDIHLTSGPLQRWLGLADIHIQTASGSMTAEMTIEGLQESEMMRDFLYSRMRGYKDPAAKGAAIGATAVETPVAQDEGELVAVLKRVEAELRSARQSIERATGVDGGGS